jgi:hypothetical protein
MREQWRSARRISILQSCSSSSSFPLLEIGEDEAENEDDFQNSKLET